MELIDIRQMATALAMSPTTIRKYKREMIEGVHFVKPNSRLVRYRKELVLDFFQNYNDPIAHQAAIDQFLASQPSNQPKKRGRKAA